MSVRRHLLFALAIPLVAPVALAQPGTLTALDYRAKTPAGWAARTSTSSMRLAEYVVGGEGSKTEVVVYFFGQGQGGSADANIARWRGQFSSTPAGEAYEKIEEDRGGAFPITVAEWRGTYARGIGPGGEQRPGQTLVAAIVATPRGTLFFQLFGPSKDVAAARAEYLNTVRALK
jgi:hypothetical protein